MKKMNLNGKYTVYFRNGNIQQEGNYSNGNVNFYYYDLNGI